MAIANLTLAPVGNIVLVVLLALILVGLQWFGPSRRKTTSRRRMILSGLRLAVLLLLLLALLRPTLVYTQTKKQTSTVAFLLDQSRSMQVTDAAGGTSRWDTLRQTMLAASDVIDAMDDEFELRFYTFGEDLHELRSEDSDHALPELPQLAESPQTAIGASLEDLTRREAGRRLRAIVLFGDGAQRAYAPRDAPPHVAARRLADLGFPLVTVPVGEARVLGDVRDVALRELLVNEMVFVKNQLTAEVVLRIDGFVNTDIPVQMLFEQSPGQMEVVSTATVRADENGKTTSVELNYIPQVPGEYKLTVRVEPQPGELITTNNELSTFVTVKKGGLNVLYVEGRRRPEVRFLLDALDGSPNIKIDLDLIDAHDLDTRPNDFADRFKPGAYDVYLLGDIDAQGIGDELLTQLGKRVEEGSGLMMLGGVHSFGPGGYQGTALNPVLPIVMDRFERQGLDDPISADLHLEGDIRMEPTPAGLRHFILRLDTAERNSSVWEDLPPLRGANRFRGIQPGANVLVESSRGDPLLVARPFGRGLVLAFAGDSTWRWHMRGFEDAHRRFWRQVILWLAHRDQATEGNVWVRLDQRRFFPGQRIEFSAGAENPQGDIVGDARYKARVETPDGQWLDVRLRRDGDTVSGVFSEGTAPGDYKIEVTASDSKAVLGTAHARFLVEQRDLELENPAADPSLMASLAEVTGGQTLAPEQLVTWLRELQESPDNVVVETQSRKTLWDTWPFFLLFVGLLCVEWWLRKRWGLV